MHRDERSAAFLLLLQKDLFGTQALSHEERDAEAERIMLAAIPEGERAAVGRAINLPEALVPTPYESAKSYRILTDLTADIFGALAEDAALPTHPLIGTLPVGWPTAILLRVPDSPEHLVVVDVAFPVFANLLAKACAQGLMPDPDDPSEEGWRRGLESGAHAGVQRFIELMTATLDQGPAAASPYWPDAEWSGIASQLRAAIELFVLTHPFAHLALRHTEESPVLPLSGLHPMANSYQWRESQRVEAFCLRVAVTASVFDKHGFDKSLGYWGIEMFLKSVALLETLQARLRGLEPPSESIALEELGLLRPLLAHGEGENSRSVALLDRLSPIADAFLRQAALAVGGQAGGVH